jgi:hypothetical protein
MLRVRHLPLIPLVALLGCDLFSNDDDGNGDGDIIDPEVTQAYLQRNFTKIPRITEAMARVLLTLNGSPQQGVTFVPITGGVQGTVGVDLDGNGSLETTIDARVILNNPSVGIAGGAVITVTAINAASTTGTASASLTVQGASSVTFTGGSATLFPTQGPSEIGVSNANLTVSGTQASPLILGSADFASTGTVGTAFFESNGSGGFQIRVTSPDFATFTVP